MAAGKVGEGLIRDVSRWSSDNMVEPIAVATVAVAIAVVPAANSPPSWSLSRDVFLDFLLMCLISPGGSVRVIWVVHGEVLELPRSLETIVVDRKERWADAVGVKYISRQYELVHCASLPCQTVNMSLEDVV